MSQKETYLLIDTSTWIGIQRSQPLVLESLIKLVNSGKVSLLVPALVKKEWTRHKKSFKSDEAAKLNSIIDELSKFNAYKDITSSLKVLQEEIGAEIESVCRKRIAEIDSLIRGKTSRSIPSFAKAKKQASELAIEKMAGFNHKNKFSDVIIFLSMAEYVNKNNLTNVYFVTSNFTDFSVAKNIEKLHPDLEGFVKIENFQYSINLGMVLNEIEAASVPEQVVVQISGLNDLLETIANMNRQIAATSQISLQRLTAFEAFANFNTEVAATLQASLQPLAAVEALTNFQKNIAATLQTLIQPLPAFEAMEAMKREMAVALKAVLGTSGITKSKEDIEEEDSL